MVTTKQKPIVDTQKIKGKRGKKIIGRKNREKNCSVDLNVTITIITLKVNCLSIPIKRQRW